MRNYITKHQGIAAYLVSEGHEIIDSKPSVNKRNHPCVEFTFVTSVEEGRELGDAFFNGTATGNLQKFHEALKKIKEIAYVTRKSGQATTEE